MGLVSVQGPLPPIVEDGDALSAEVTTDSNRRLSEELDRVRRQNARARRWYAAGSVLVVAFSIGGLVWALNRDPAKVDPATPTATTPRTAAPRDLGWNPGGRLKSARTRTGDGLRHGLYVIGDRPGS